jgi:hypothetical protein
MANLPFFTLAQLEVLFKAPIDGERISMKIEQAKHFLRAYEHGEKLDSPTIRELYLAGYIGIELHSPDEDPRPTFVTEEGKKLLES